LLDGSDATRLATFNARVGTVITEEYVTTFDRDVYLWGRPLINARQRRASFARALEPGYQGGVLPPDH